jgi:ornithine racemase
MPAPTLAIDLDVIAANAAAITARCSAAGISVIGVTKATGGSPQVARAMLRGGVTGFGESRIDNVRRLRRGGITQPITMLRIPSITEAPDVVRHCDVSLNSEAQVLRALSEAATEQGREHQVIVMLEMGDRREGVTAAELMPLCDLVLGLPGLRLKGLGANFMCASGVLPTEAKLEALVAQFEAVEARFGIRLDTLSGGNSANLNLMETAPLPGRINELRIGSAILRAEDAIADGYFPWLRPDAFTLKAELVEMKVKPSLPEGKTGRDAFGNLPVFADRGDRVRGIVNLGRVDIRLEGLTPRDADVEITTASSDHLIVDLTGARRFAVGDAVAFDLDYGALVQAFLSPYVAKRLAGRDAAPVRPERVRLLADPGLLARGESRAFAEAIRGLGLEPVEGGALTEGDLPLWMPPDRDPAWSQIVADLPDRAELGMLWLDSEPGPSLEAHSDTLALVGLRKVSEAQAARIHADEVLALTMEDIDLMGIREAMRRALARVTAMTAGFVLVLDASVGRGMEPDEMEAGLSYRECSTAMELVANSGGLRGLAMTGFDPDAKSSALTAAYGYLLSALGKRILGHREAS